MVVADMVSDRAIVAELDHVAPSFNRLVPLQNSSQVL
jgi:hypothetical protein